MAPQIRTRGDGGERTPFPTASIGPLPGDYLSPRARLLALAAVVGLLAAGWAVVWTSGGTHTPLPHLMYAPILVAAWAFGARGALLAAVAAGLAMGPVMPLDTAAGVPQEPVNWLYRTGFYVSVGAIAGLTNGLLLRRAEMLRASEAKFGTIARNATDLIVIADETGMVQYASPAAEPMLGCSAEELVGTKLSLLVHPGDREPLSSALQVRGAEDVPPSAATVELRLRHSDGSWRHAEAVVTNLAGDPTVRGVALNIRDMTERQAMESQLLHQALHDSLTGLANRELFAQRVGEVLSRPRAASSGTAVLLFDLDRFKSVEETFGPEAADRVVQAIASRLENCLRPGDVLARPQGSDFAMLCEGIEDSSRAAQIAERLLEAIREPLLTGDEELFLTASVGATVMRGTNATPDEALRDAFTAMRRAKADGGDRCALHTPGATSDGARQLKTQSALRRALERGELQLHYQPILELASGRLTSTEALIRWQHPRLGLVPPADFIPIAEDSGMIVPIGAWVIDEACRQLSSWQAEHGGPQRVSVNLSARQLGDPALVPAVIQALAAHGIAPDALVLEITETALIQHADLALAVLRQLKAIGVRIAIDDFGTGYSSLGYLHQLPIDTLKIDRSFVRDLGQGGDTEAIVSAVIGLAHTLKLDTVAEGVETEEQADKLFELGCKRVQGYLYSRPKPPAELTDLIRAGGVAVPAQRQLRIAEAQEKAGGPSVGRRALAER